jgi:hypothetical protein
MLLKIKAQSRTELKTLEMLRDQRTAMLRRSSSIIFMNEDLRLTPLDEQR